MPEPDNSTPPAGNATTPDGRSTGVATVTAPPAAGRYVLGKEIARGGMGAVYRATDTTLVREVAVKVLLADPRESPSYLRRFDDEARIAAQLQHPAIPPVHDLGTLPDGRPFLAMKLIRGETLDAQLRARPDPSADRGRFVAVFEQICQAVAYAHSQRIIHRDLKPLNVMVGAFGEVQVMDWGLAKMLPDSAAPPSGGRQPPVGQPELPATGAADDTAPHAAADRPAADRTREGQGMGTPSYMPPEQANGDLEQTDRRADVFALGGILCTILTGQPPYTGRTSQEVIRKAKAGDLGEALARLGGCGADAELIAVCKQCLTADVAARPADAGAVAELVRAYRAGVEERLRAAERQRAAAEAKAQEQRRKRRWQLVAAGAAFLLVLGGGAFAWWEDKRATNRRIEEERLANEKLLRDTRNRDAFLVSLERCETALRDENDADTARLAYTDIENRMPEGGVEDYTARVERCRVDLEMLKALDEVAEVSWTPVENRPPSTPVITERWQQVFARFGVALGTTTPTEAARLVKNSLVRERLLGALDHWLLSAPSPALAEILKAADPDEYRDAMRTMVCVGYDFGFLTLALQDRMSEQPLRFVVAASLHPSLPQVRKRMLLSAASLRLPKDLPILMGAGGTYPIDRREGAAERLRWYQAAVAAHPRSRAAWNNLGLAQQDNGDPDGAITANLKALKLDPNLSPALNNLGNAYQAKGQYDDAIATYRKTIEIDPKWAAAHYNLGNALKAKERFDDAIAAYHDALKLNPKFAQAYFNLGNTYARLGRLDDAIAEYHKAIENDPENHRFYNDLGTVLKDRGRRDDAITAFRTSIRLNSEDVHAHYNLANALREAGKLDEAIEEWKETIKREPKHVRAHYNLGLALKSKGLLDDAIVAYREAVRHDPKLASAHNNLAVIFIQQERYPQAIASARAAIAADSKMASAHALLGFALRDTGDIPGARAALTEAARLDSPRYASFLAELPPLEVAPPPREKNPRP